MMNSKLIFLFAIFFFADRSSCQDAEVVQQEKLSEVSSEDSAPASSTTTTDSDAAATDEAPGIEETEAKQTETADEQPVQSGPFIDLLGPNLLSLEMVNENQARVVQNLTTDMLTDKKVIGLYFSADWCGPCRKFTPELVSFYNKMNSRRGKKDQFQIVWVSRCRDVNSFGQYFTHMPWLALPPEEAMGPRGQMLGEKYKVKGIPHLALLDDLGNLITTDGRNKIPQDKAGIGFPWRNPLATLYMTIVPRSLRLMVKSQVSMVREKTFSKLKNLIGISRPMARKA